MTLHDVVRALRCDVRSCAGCLDRSVSGAYVGDLLSEAMARSGPGMLWITRQVHAAMVGVAALKEHAAVLIVHGAAPDIAVCAKADREQVVILTTGLPAFDAAGIIYGLLHKHPVANPAPRGTGPES